MFTGNLSGMLQCHGRIDVRRGFTSGGWAWEEEFDEDGEDEEGLELDDNLAFIEVPGQRRMGATQPQAGPSRLRRRRTAIRLDDDEDTRVEDIDETAGEVIGSGETVREDWRRHFARQAEEERTSRKGKGKSEYFVKTAV